MEPYTNAALNLYVQVLVWMYFLFYWGAKLLDHKV